MADNRNSDPLNMQNLKQDAIRRAQDMQSRARIPPYSPPAHGGAEPNASARRPGSEENTPHPHVEQMPIFPAADPPENSKEADPLLPGLGDSLDFLFKDSERALILVLMLILLDEKSDTGLIFGLLYLLL